MLSFEGRNPLAIAVTQFIITLIVAILVITVVWGDPLREALTLGAVFGIIFAIITYLTDRDSES
jgi:hypothetical protein